MDAWRPFAGAGAALPYSSVASRPWNDRNFEGIRTARVGVLAIRA